MLRVFDHLNQLYEKEKNILIDTILKYHLRKESAKENSSKPSPLKKKSNKENTSKPSPSRKESVEENTSKPSTSRKDSAKENTSKPSPSRKDSVEENSSNPSPSRRDSAKENTSKPSPKNVVLRTGQTEIVKQIVTPKKQIRIKKSACNEASISEE